MKKCMTYRALVVEDQSFLRSLLKRALEGADFACDAVANGTEALRQVQSADYDVVVTDLRMPQGNGHALCVELLKLQPVPTIVVLTGVMEPRLADDLRARGIGEIHFKPVNLQQFSARVRGIVALRKPSMQQLCSLPCDETPPAEQNVPDRSRRKAPAEPVVSSRGASAAARSGPPLTLRAPQVVRATNVSTEEDIPPLALQRVRTSAGTHQPAALLRELCGEVFSRFNLPETEDIAARIAAEAQMSDLFLRYVNHSGNRPERRVSDVAMAASLLGPARTIAVAASISVCDWLLNVLGDESERSARWLRTRCLTVATSAQAVFPAAATNQSTRAFLLGLLQELGWALLALEDPQSFQRLRRAAQAESPGDLIHRERRQFQVTHSDLSAALLTHWMFPQTVVRLVLRHHVEESESNSAAQILTGVMRIAEAYADYLAQPSELLRERFQETLFRHAPEAEHDLAARFHGVAESVSRLVGSLEVVFRRERTRALC